MDFWCWLQKDRIWLVWLQALVYCNGVYYRFVLRYYSFRSRVIVVIVGNGDCFSTPVIKYSSFLFPKTTFLWYEIVQRVSVKLWFLSQLRWMKPEMVGKGGEFQSLGIDVAYLCPQYIQLQFLRRYFKRSVIISDLILKYLDTRRCWNIRWHGGLLSCKWPRVFLFACPMMWRWGL